MNDYSFLRDLFALLDTRLEFLVESIELSNDPDGMGLLDDAEYVFGMGLIAAQRYLASTYGPRNIPKNIALNAGPAHQGGETIARIINAAANYWKHIEEWKLEPVVYRDRNGLERIQTETMRVIESVTPWADYTLANLLHDLIGEPKLSLLLPVLEQWNADLSASSVG